MYLGVDYYPHYFLDSDVEKELDNILAMNANFIRIGDFAWSLMEPTKGNYDFGYFKDIVNKAFDRNIDVMICTPTSTFPAWLKKLHPEILIVDENKNRIAFGGRREYCYNSDIYLEYAKKISVEMVLAFKDDTNVVSIQIDNEFAHEGSDMCYCDTCQDKFRKYLEAKFKTLDNLNRIAGNVFWSKTYTSWDEIELPTKTITYHNPFMSLEHLRFRSYSITKFGSELIKVVNEAKGLHQTVTHNYYPGFFNLAMDQNEISKELDFVSYDNYPVWGGLKEPIEPAQVSLNHDYMRGLKNSNYWVVEQIMGAQGHDIIGYLPRINQSKMWSYHAMAHGCENLLYFSYRTCAIGQEQFCYGLIDQDNINNRRYEEAKSFFTDISNFKDYITTPIKARVAVVYDFDNIWGFKTQRQSMQFDFMNEILRCYRAFYGYNVSIDVINIDKDFSSYDILCFPVMQIIDEDLANKIKEQTTRKTSIIFTYRSGLKNKDGNVHLGLTAPSYIKDLVGATILEVESLQAGQNPVIVMDNKKYQMDTFREILQLDKAEALATYELDEFASNVAISRNTYNNASVYYVGGGLDVLGMKHLAKLCLDSQEIDYEESVNGIEIVKRNSSNGEIKFYINHLNETCAHNGIILNPYEVKII